MLKSLKKNWRARAENFNFKLRQLNQSDLFKAHSRFLWDDTGFIRPSVTPTLSVIHSLSVQQKNEWKIGRTRIAVGTWVAGECFHRHRGNTFFGTRYSILRVNHTHWQGRQFLTEKLCSFPSLWSYIEKRAFTLNFPCNSTVYIHIQRLYNNFLEFLQSKKTTYTK